MWIESTPEEFTEVMKENDLDGPISGKITTDGHEGWFYTEWGKDRDPYSLYDNRSSHAYFRIEFNDKNIRFFKMDIIRIKEV